MAVRWLILVLVMICSGTVRSQQLYRGIVADSATFANLPAVYVIVKGTNKFSSTNAEGSFLIDAKLTDTLIFRMVGYKSRVLPLILEEDALLVLMSEDKIMLSGVVIKGWRLYPNEVEDHTQRAPKTMELFTATGFSPFDYFWKVQREKRKLKKIIARENRTQVYSQVITDPLVREIMVHDHHISKETYFRLLAQFNTRHESVQYYKDPDAIMVAIHEFIDQEIKK